MLSEDGQIWRLHNLVGKPAFPCLDVANAVVHCVNLCFGSGALPSSPSQSVRKAKKKN